MMQSHTEFSIESGTVNAGMSAKGKVRGKGRRLLRHAGRRQALPEGFGTDRKIRVSVDKPCGAL